MSARVEVMVEVKSKDGDGHVIVGRATRGRVLVACYPAVGKPVTVIVDPEAMLDAVRRVSGQAAPDLVRSVDPPSIVDAAGVADIAGLAKSTVLTYRAAGKLPAPWTRIGGADVWLRADVERWVEERKGAR